MSRARAMVWTGGGDFRLLDLPLPEVAELAVGESLVRLSVATICGSDRHTVSGRRAGACPSILGHEGVGTVLLTRHPDLVVGQRVVFSVTASCGSCRHCRHGLSAKCEDVAKTGHEPLEGAWPLSGTYATHIRLLAGQAVSVVPAQVPDAVASTAGCAVATVMAMLERAGDLRGRRVLVNGAGMLGMVAIVAARAAGAEHVIACDISERTLELAALCADEVLTPEAVCPTVDVALELSGAASGVEMCLRCLELGGTAVLAGSVAPGPEITVDPEWLVRGWHTITGVHNYEPRHLEQAVDFLATEGRQLPWGKLLGGPVALTELPGQFQCPDGTLRTVVTL